MRIVIGATGLSPGPTYNPGAGNRGMTFVRVMPAAAQDTVEQHRDQGKQAGQM